ncbi:alcohol dehydrogenase family protein [Rhizobium rhizophilum]|nr:alcohol dehydrogenase family protein [Rhizobium rhizophilum]
MTAQMQAVVTTATGGDDKLCFTTVPFPVPGKGEVLLKVLAAGVNNTDINTRLGWYAASVSTGTQGAAEDATASRPDGGWGKPTPFPLIQGTDCCGEVVSVGPAGDSSIIGSRVLVRACMRPNGFASMDNIWMGSDFDGAFAQFVKVPASEIFAVDCSWTDAELATIPCAYGTAENMLHRARVSAGMRVLISGASGGVGSAAVQLAKRRGAEVIGISAKGKHDIIRSIGADRMLDRDEDVVGILRQDSIDIVVDNVAGPGFGAMLQVLKRGGTYVSSGAIAGPIVELDMRDFYLKNLTLLGCTAWEEPVFPDLISYIERGEIRPLLDRTYRLDQIALAQREFLEKRHVGKMVLMPPQ